MNVMETKMLRWIVDIRLADRIRNEKIPSDVANTNSDDENSAEDEAVNGSEEPTPVAQKVQTAVANPEQQSTNTSSLPTEGSIARSTENGPVQRRFNYVPVNTVSFALPDGYSTSRSDIEFLGSGAYGNVIKTLVECRDGEVRAVAVKKFRDPFCDQLQARMIYREIKLLQIMRHDGVIRAIDLYTPNTVEHEFKDVYVVTEYAGDSIVKILHDQKVTGRTHITPEHVPFIIYQLLRVLKYIHSANIIHRDLKPGNLALTSDSDLTVLDFGMARSLERTETSLTQYVMTRWYRSPEVIYWNIDGYNEQANAQYEMITSLCGSPDEELMRKIEATSPATRRVVESYPFHKRQNFTQRFSGCPPLFIDFLDKILVLDPEKRLTVEGSLSHPYFADYVDATDEPTAPSSFDLNDNPSRSRDEWKAYPHFNTLGSTSRFFQFVHRLWNHGKIYQSPAIWYIPDATV
ncbi:kinase domain protein [Ancylostoma ceylanicum]|uniref:Kinase domain protein n=1 Tax=Ancylostoma ceylanicum TaxID=53326 RepID=A0A0D6LX03_9BILA|nr:kinase domain protein [Ancylostoma ceylanicum]